MTTLVKQGRSAGFLRRPGTFLAPLRGLAIGLSISVLNLVGVFLTMLLIGGLGEWTAMQFVGIFGLFEIGTGIAFIVCPNVWRMPVSEANTSERTRVQLSASTLFIPHWAGGVKSIAGLVMVASALIAEGAAPSSLLLLPVAVAIAVLTVAISAAAARWGTERIDLDVYFFIVRRPGHDDFHLPGISLTASTLQIVLGTFTLPFIKLLPPGTFYQPAFAPSAVTFAAFLAAAAISTALALAVWWGRLSWRAPREQQREMETASG